MSPKLFLSWVQKKSTAWRPNCSQKCCAACPVLFSSKPHPARAFPIIRGLKGSQVLHLVDGMRLNNAFFRNAPNQYLGLVDAYATERTEIIRGAAPSLYGADAMGGVLQVLTAEPDFHRIGLASARADFTAATTASTPA